MGKLVLPPLFLNSFFVFNYIFTLLVWNNVEYTTPWRLTHPSNELLTHDSSLYYSEYLISPRVLKGQASHHSQVYSPLYENSHFPLVQRGITIIPRWANAVVFFVFSSFFLNFRLSLYHLPYIACRFSFKLTFAPALPRLRQAMSLHPFLAEQHGPAPPGQRWGKRQSILDSYSISICIMSLFCNLFLKT